MSDETKRESCIGKSSITNLCGPLRLLAKRFGGNDKFGDDGVNRPCWQELDALRVAYGVMPSYEAVPEVSGAEEAKAAGQPAVQMTEVTGEEFEL